MGTEKNGDYAKMKVLYLGHYREYSGRSFAAMNHILALSSIGIDVSCRNIQLTSHNQEVPEEIIRAEKNNLKNIDFCIQNVLPQYIVGTKKFKKNVAFCNLGSKIGKTHPWIPYFKMVDDLWVSNHSSQEMLKDINIKSTLIPYAFDTSIYSKEVDILNLGRYQNKFKFYFIGNLDDRKNIDGIIRSYLRAFKKSDPVCMVMKVRKFGRTDQQIQEMMRNKIESIKSHLNIYKKSEHYPDLLVVSQDLTNDQIQSLHKTCDCFVGISHGEGWCIPAYEAMCYGNTPICSKQGGPLDFIDENNPKTGTLINGIYSTCSHSEPPFPNIFTGNETWFIPSEEETSNVMKYYFNNRLQKSTDGLECGENFSHSRVGQKIKEALHE